MAIDIDKVSTGTETLSIFYYDPATLFNIQKGFIPKQVLLKIISTESGTESYIRGWQSYLTHLGKNPHWRLCGNIEPEDFASSMLMGHIPAKDAIQAQGGVLNAPHGYNPTRDGTRPTICPTCGSSFWSYEHGNTLKCFADWDIVEFRNNRNECMPPVKVKGVKVCSHIIAGPFENQAAAQIAGNGKEAVLVNNQWVVICGHPVDLMSFSNFTHKFVMRPLKAEQKRFVTAKTKGRSNNSQAFSCACCGVVNEYNEDFVNEDDGENPTIDCTNCGKTMKVNSLQIFVREKSHVSLDAPLTDDGKATVGDMLPSPVTVDNERRAINTQISEYVHQFRLRIENITGERLKGYQLKLLERKQSRLPAVRRALEKAKLRKETAKIEELTKKLLSEEEGLITDQNRIDYTRALPDMYYLHYFGDDEYEKYDFRELTEKFMFKSLPYTQCNDCKTKMFELNETGKIEKDFVNARIRLRERAQLEDVPGYDRQMLIDPAVPLANLLPHLGKYFHCDQCGGHNLSYYGPGKKNCAEPRIEITPHIFQPAQRELTDLHREIFAYKLRCPQCANENVIRPDKVTGELPTNKISKRIVHDEDGTRRSLRQEIEHTCSRCNHLLNVEEDMIESSNEKDAYDIIAKIQDLVNERQALDNMTSHHSSN